MNKKLFTILLIFNFLFGRSFLYSMQKANLDRFENLLSIYNFYQNEENLAILLSMFDFLENKDKAKAYQMVKNFYNIPENIGFTNPESEKKLEEDFVPQSDTEADKYLEKLQERVRLEKFFENLESKKNKSKITADIYEKLLNQNLKLEENISKLKEDLVKLSNENKQLLKNIDSLDFKLNQIDRSDKSRVRANNFYLFLNNKLREEIEELKKQIIIKHNN